VRMRTAVYPPSSPWPPPGRVTLAPASAIRNDAGVIADGQVRTDQSGGAIRSLEPLGPMERARAARANLGATLPTQEFKRRMANSVRHASSQRGSCLQRVTFPGGCVTSHVYVCVCVCVCPWDVLPGCGPL
jgi:hypothetical protein